MYDDDDYLAGGDDRYDWIYPEPGKQEPKPKEENRMINASELKLMQRQKKDEDLEKKKKQVETICEMIGKKMIKRVEEGSPSMEVNFIILHGMITREPEKELDDPPLATSVDFFPISLASMVKEYLECYGYSVKSSYDRTNCNGNFTVSWEDAKEAVPCKPY